MDWARERLWITLRILSKPKGTKGFVVLPRRWKVERTLVAAVERTPAATSATTNACPSTPKLT